MAVEPVARPFGLGTEIGSIMLTAATNLAVNRVLPGSAYVPASLGAAGSLTWFARRGGAAWSDMGMAPSNIRRGLRLGLLVSVPVAAVVPLGIALPATRRFFIDERLRHTERREILYETLVRIPFGTALAEEILFRGALSGTFRLRRSRVASEVMSGAMFGLWHVLPTIDRLGRNPAGRRVSGSFRVLAATLGGGVLMTAAAGFGLARLRDRTGSLAAPAVVHGALNSLAYLGSVWISRASRQQPAPLGPAWVI
jgi:uncharacterized protein